MKSEQIKSKPPTGNRRHDSSNALFSPCSVLLLTTCSALLVTTCGAFLPRTSFLNKRLIFKQQISVSSTSLRMIYAPPGSGYATSEDEESYFPDTYEPMMEYPGTMRPGRTPENMPFSDLPIGDDDPDPVPWPHFQQIDWHHKWDPPHPHPIPVEDFIEMNGRWATPEMEAAMRAGVRRDVRERREQEAENNRDMVITDDDDDEDTTSDEPISLGDGMFGKLGSADDEALTREAVRPKADGEDDDENDMDEEGVEDDDLDNFLLDLGLDADMEDGDDEEENEGSDTGSAPAPAPGGKTRKLLDLDLDDDEVDFDDADDDKGTIDMVSDGGEVRATINVDEEDDLDLGLDDEDDMEDDGVSTVPLEDFSDDNDTLDGEDIFDEGGFDFDDGDFDGGDDDW